MISQGWKRQRRPDEEAPLQIKRVSTQGARAPQRGGWLDDMLGQGSARTVGLNARTLQAKAASASRSEALGPRRAEATLRMRAVDSASEPKALKPKGYLRIVLGGLALLFFAAKARPWLSQISMKMPLTQVPQEKPPESAPKAPISPLMDAGGSPIALWRSASGEWSGINAKAELSRMLEAEASSNLKLPRLEGPALVSVEKHSGHVLALQVDPDELNQLLPLRAELAAEVDSVTVQGRNVVLHMHSGSTAALGEGDFKRKEARLASVLSDLQARGKRPGSVDLRFENTAVVRLASR